jgi:hypothetical protein
MIRSIEKSNDLIGNLNRYLPACIIVPQRISRIKSMYCIFTYLFVLYLMTLPVNQTIGASNDWAAMNLEGHRLSMASLSPFR